VDRPADIRRRRALLRHRTALVRLRTLVRNRVHAVLADYGHDRPCGGCWSAPGRAWLAGIDLPDVPRRVVDELAVLLDAIQPLIDAADRTVGQARSRTPGSRC